MSAAGASQRTSQGASQLPPCWQPTLPHRHGALVAVLAAFQTEHPLVQQIRRRRNLQPRLLLWGGIDGAIALGAGLVVAAQTPALIAIAGVATTGALEPSALGLWGVCSLYFGSSVVLLKLRPDQQDP